MRKFFKLYKWALLSGLSFSIVPAAMSAPVKRYVLTPVTSSIRGFYCKWSSKG
jgi:hypothetical protein